MPISVCQVPATPDDLRFLELKRAMEEELSALHEKFPHDHPLAGIVFALTMHDPGYNDARTIAAIKGAIGFPEMEAFRAYAEFAPSYYRQPPDRCTSSN